jgi:hypothetical protein
MVGGIVFSSLCPTGLPDNFDFLTSAPPALPDIFWPLSPSPVHDIFSFLVSARQLYLIFKIFLPDSCGI